MIKLTGYSFLPQLGTAAEEVCQFSRNYCSWIPFLSCCAGSGRVKESYSLFSPLSKTRVKVEVVRDWELSRTGKHALLIDSWLEQEHLQLTTKWRVNALYSLGLGIILNDF